MSSVRMVKNKFGVREWRERVGNKEDWKRAMKEVKALEWL